MLNNQQIKGEGIREAVTKAVVAYYDTLGDHSAENLYRQAVDELERPLLEEVMKRSRGNQSKAALDMGLNRATLRSKLKRHGLM